ncbi:multiple epidermal growth factor-like domains protein 10 isoform X2 [Saccostrea echinata]|uniref:multiple epidermal growth factor-like domains protein 10 isoform X2 n=1 Tax=Saccostrea echinata TaxID=191078 RepID=UPI002A823A9E|nr:multiple epidermal growth factor-like domains protein 10 isoform X2 [Saccostrea echinata]
MGFCDRIFISTTIWFVTFTIGYTQGYENVALNKPTEQSNEYRSSTFGGDIFDSSNAVDGLKTNLSALGGQCAISGYRYRSATWWVNLTSIHSIHYIRIYYRTDNVPWGASNGYTTRFLGFYIYISNTTNIEDGHLCFHDTIYNRSTIPAVVNITCPIHGQYVIYFNKRPQESPYADQFSIDAHNELCEVEVYGCNKTGHYGPTCSLPCPDTNCRYCHIETGACQGCRPGYQGHRCELPCKKHFYGEVCKEKCGNCSDGVTCHHVNGKCTNGCDFGVYEDKCKTTCPVGWHGKNCSDKCSNCDTCDRITGQCTSQCHVGWKGKTCREECAEGLYGQNCTKRCGACLHYRQCHHVNGSCLEGCDTGFKGELCQTVCDTGYFGYDCEDECSKFCKISRHCNHMTGFCKGGCKTGWQGKDCFQVQILKEKDCESRFYGVLITLCFCVLLFAVIVAVLCLKRKHKAIKMKEDDTEMYHQAQSIHSKKGTTENTPGDYQELGSLGQPSTYEAINHQPR